VATFDSTQDPFALPAPMAVERLGRSMRAFPEGEPRYRYLFRRFVDAPTLPLVRLIACAQREAAMGAPEARVVFDAFGSLMTRREFSDDFRSSLAEAAEQLSEFALLGVINGELAEEVPPDWVPKIVPRGSLAEAGETLGRRKSLARTASGDTLDRLLIDPHPDVIRNVLVNSRVSEAMVVRLASRPTVSPPILQVIAQSRFQTRASVRRALASNPKCPPGLGCRLLPALTRAELLDIAHDRRIHDDVRNAARMMIDSKPPRLSEV
jgi:hypothetical protein